MGVKTLWTILDCCGEKVDLRELRGQTLAVDLAGWVVQDSQCRSMTGGGVSKPHLRNVFFRAATLVTLGIRPLFVLDGAAPELKRDTLAARNSKQCQPQQQSLGRGRLKAVLGECRFLLNAMGFKCIQADGEGEALCARLNREELVDAVVTEDSDAFCYGAKTVLRNFSVKAGGISVVERFDAAKFRRNLGLSRDRLVLMAVLLGCDFVPSGVGGVGKESVMQLFAGWRRDWDALDIMEFWIQTGFEQFQSCDECGIEGHCHRCQQWMRVVRCQDCLCVHLCDGKRAKLENAVKKKCAVVDESWWETEYPKVVCEFQQGNHETLPDVAQCRKLDRPKVGQCMTILVKKLAWAEDYAQERMIPLFTRWQLEHNVECSLDEVARPVRIGKKRTVNGVPSLTIEWKVVEARRVDAQGLPEEFESVEPAALVEAAYPDIHGAFLATSAKPKKKATAAPRAKSKKENVAPPPLAPITHYFTQKKSTAIVVPKEVKNVKDSAKLVESIQLSDSDCSDLSFIIDDILSKRVGNLTVEMEDVDGPVEFVTSTPAAKATSSRTKVASFAAVAAPPKPILSVFRHNMTSAEVTESPNDETEDSFDRMCR